MQTSTLATQMECTSPFVRVWACCAAETQPWHQGMSIKITPTDARLSSSWVWRSPSDMEYPCNNNGNMQIFIIIYQTAHCLSALICGWTGLNRWSLSRKTIGVKYVIRKYVIRALIRVLRIMGFGSIMRSVLQILIAYFWTHFDFIKYAHRFLNGWQF